MAVVGTEPEGLDVANLAPGQMVRVVSDATTNLLAVLDVEQWAREHGLLRVAEGHLAVKLTRDRRRLRCGVCYRPHEGELEAIRAAVAEASAEISALVAQMPETCPSDVLLRMGDD
jgi:hypothetical protein